MISDSIEDNCDKNISKTCMDRKNKDYTKMVAVVRQHPIASPGGKLRLSINLFVGAGVPDGPHANVANSPKTIKNPEFYRRGVEDAAPYDL